MISGSVKSRPDHPRVRGDDPDGQQVDAVRIGPPPRARDDLATTSSRTAVGPPRVRGDDADRCHAVKRVSRTTPACAGTTRAERRT